jgi:hypothetical protein
MVNEVEEKFDISGVHPWVKYGLALLLIFALIDSFLSERYINIIPIGIAWFFAGPQCVKWARKEKHNLTWAFFIGVMFNLVGVLAYWLHIKRLSYPILGGVAAILLSSVALILITILKLPVILPILQSYSDHYGIMGSLIWFVIWFIAGFIIVYHHMNSEKENGSS